MSSATKNAGGESPPPETQSGRQLHDAPASGQGTDKMDNKEQTNDDQLKVLFRQSTYTTIHRLNHWSSIPVRQFIKRERGMHAE